MLRQIIYLILHFTVYRHGQWKCSVKLMPSLDTNYLKASADTHETARFLLGSLEVEGILHVT